MLPQGKQGRKVLQRAFRHPAGNLFAHFDGCSPHTEELRRSSSPGVFSIAVTMYDGQKMKPPTFCQRKEKE